MSPSSTVSHCITSPSPTSPCSGPVIPSPALCPRSPRRRSVPSSRSAVASATPSTPSSMVIPPPSGSFGPLLSFFQFDFRSQKISAFLSGATLHTTPINDRSSGLQSELNPPRHRPHPPLPRGAPVHGLLPRLLPHRHRPPPGIPPPPTPDPFSFSFCSDSHAPLRSAAASRCTRRRIIPPSTAVGWSQWSTPRLESLIFGLFGGSEMAASNTAQACLRSHPSPDPLLGPGCRQGHPRP